MLKNPSSRYLQRQKDRYEINQVGKNMFDKQ